MQYVKFSEEDFLKLKQTGIHGVTYSDVVELCVKEVIRDELDVQDYVLDYTESRRLTNTTYEDIVEHGVIEDLESHIRDTLTLNYMKLGDKI